MVQPQRRSWLQMGAVVLVLAVAGGAWYTWRTRAVPADAVQLRPGPLVRTVQFSARVQALSRVDIGSTLTGRVAQVLVSDGDQVRQGQVLVRLESDELRSTQAQAVASHRQASARLSGLRSTGRSAANAALAQAQAAVDATEAEYARVQQLVNQGFLSASRQDDARRLRDVALAQRDAAQAQLRALAESGTEVAQAQAQAALATSAVAAAHARLAQTELRAPADGLVLSRAVEPGQIVQPGRNLITLALAGPTQLVAQVDERFLEQLRVGQPAYAVADAYPGQRFAASILSIAPTVDAQRGSIEVKFTVQALPAFLRQDMTLSIEVETGRRERALALPVAALTSPSDPSRASVRVVVDGRIQDRSVQLGLRTLHAVEVTSGLAQGDVVALDPDLPAGRKVRAVLQPLLLVAPARAGDGGAGGAALTNAMGR